MFPHDLLLSELPFKSELVLAAWAGEFTRDETKTFLFEERAKALFATGSGRQHSPAERIQTELPCIESYASGTLGLCQGAVHTVSRPIRPHLCFSEPSPS